MNHPAKRYHCDREDPFVQMFFIPMDWDCYECNSVFTIKTRHSIETIETALIEKGWHRHQDVKGRWTCPDCQKAKTEGRQIPRTSEESFWYGCA